MWYGCDFFQDFLEELKLVVRGSLFQVASLQDCFLQQSEPLATASTGVGSGAGGTPPSVQIKPQAPRALGPTPERGTSAENPNRMCLQRSVSCAKVQDKKICPLHFCFYSSGMWANSQ